MKLRIATWNIERPRTGRSEKINALVERMKSVEADIWILTESHEDVSPGSEFKCVATTRIDNPLTHSPGENRTSIWSRLPITEGVATFDKETAVCVNINTPLGPMLVYGTVIPYHAAGTKYPYRSRGFDIDGKKAWHLHYESIAEHEADLLRLQSLYPDHHFCFGGDLNQNRDGRRWYGTNKGRELLTKALDTCKLTCVTEEDFVAHGDLVERSNIDHLCLSQDLTERVTTAGVWDIEEYAPKKLLSDHNGVWIDLKAD